ncbi:MAG: hypothetical protein CNLJKLNK_00842 [Holosporales bacterium]
MMFKKIVLLFLLFLLFPFCVAQNTCLKAPIDHDWIKKRYKKRKDSDPVHVCVVVHNLGMHKQIAKKILHILPPAVSVSISPYPQSLDDLVQKIAKDGHNLLFVQPVSYYRNTSSPVDPYRVDLQNLQNKNIISAQNTFKKMPQGVKAIIAEEASPVLKDEQALTPILDALKEKKIPIISPEMALDDDFRNICKKHNVPCFEADYYIDFEKKYEDVVGILERALNLATTTGTLLLVVDAHLFNVKEVLEWIQKNQNTTFKLVCLDDYLKLF